MRLTTSLTLAFLALATTSHAELPDAKADPAGNPPKGEVVEWTSPTGQPYWYRLPKKISQSKPPNLVFMLHGTGMPWGWAFFNYPIANGQFRGDDIMVAPEGMTPGHGETFNFVQGKTDGDQILALIKLFRKHYPIGRIYLYGHSQGAFFCYWFAGEYPNLVDGIVAHAGNVLSVKHSKLARENLAVGILHGRADAVVPVDCAFRTEKIYQEQGYRKVKLYVVEGLTEQSGHWPLPQQAAEMFEWLDSVSVKTASGAIDAALAALSRSPVDLTILSEAMRSANDLARKAKGDDKADVEKRLPALNDLFTRLAAAHTDALSAEPALAERKPAYGPWVVQYVALAPAFEHDAAWSKAMKKVAQLAGKHDKTVAKAMKGLGKPSKKTVATAVAAIESSFLAAGIVNLRVALDRVAAEPPKGADDALGTYAELLATRAPMDEEGLAALAERTAALVDAFRADHPELMASEDQG